MRISAPMGGGTRISMGIGGWALYLAVVGPIVLCWWLVKGVVFVIMWLGSAAARAHEAPMVPGKLRKPPPRK